MLPNQFFQELKRRHVFKVASIYVVTTWLIIQVVATTFPMLGLPERWQQLILILLLIGFPIALVLAWAQEVQAAEPDQTKPSPFSTKLKRRLLYSAMLLMAIAGGFLLYWRLGAANSLNLPKEVLGKETNLAVMAFENQTGDNDMAFLGSYLSEVISQGFMALDSIKIVNPATVRQFIKFNDRNMDTLVNIHDYTKADYVINGSYYSKGDSLELKAYISEAKSGHSVFYFPTYSGSKSDYEELAGLIQQKILGYWVDQEDLNKNKYKPPHYQAWLEYSKGAKLWERDNVQAAVHLTKALEIEPAFFLAYSWLYWTYLHEPYRGAKADSLHLAMEKYLPEASIYEKELWEANNFHRLQNWDALEKKTYKIFLRDPQNLLDNYYAGWAAVSTNKPQKAIDIFSLIDHKFFDYDNEDSLERLAFWAHALNCLGRYKEAIDLLEKYYPKESEVLWGIWMKIRAHARLGQDKEIEVYIDQLAEENYGGDAEMRGYLNFWACKEFFLLHKDNQASFFGKRTLDAFEEARYTGRELSATHFLLGNYLESKRLVEPYLEKYPDDMDILSEMAIVLTKFPEGGVAQATEMLEIIKGSEMDEPWKQYILAQVNAHIGNKAEAVEQLRSTLGNSQFYLTNYRWDPWLRPLFDYQPFQDLVKPDMERHH